MNKEFKYETNKLLEINFQNAKCVYDTNMITINPDTMFTTV